MHSYVKLVQELEKNYKIVDISTTALELEEEAYQLLKKSLLSLESQKDD